MGTDMVSSGLFARIMVGVRADCNSDPRPEILAFRGRSCRGVEWKQLDGGRAGSFWGRVMSMAQIIPFAAMVAGGAALGVGAILPDPQPIRVHSLTYDDGMVTQSRTISPPSGQRAVAMTWVAEVYDAVTGVDVAGCHGTGANVYQAGTASASYSLAAWTGNANCTIDRFVPGRLYVLQAAWFTGGQTVMAESEPVIVRP